MWPPIKVLCNKKYEDNNKEKSNSYLKILIMCSWQLMSFNREYNKDKVNYKSRNERKTIGQKHNF